MIAVKDRPIVIVAAAIILSVRHAPGIPTMEDINAAVGTASAIASAATRHLPPSRRKR